MGKSNKNNKNNKKVGSSNVNNNKKASSSTPIVQQQPQQQQQQVEQPQHFSSIQDVLGKAIELKENWEHATAIQFLNEAIQSKAFTSNVDEHKLFDTLGELYLDAGDEISAKKSFERSVALRPQDLNFSKYMYLGQLSESEDAVQYFSKGIELMIQIKQQLLHSNTSLPNMTMDQLNQLIANGCCSICEIYMTDLCFEANAEQECERMMQLALKEDPSNTNINVFQTLASLRMSQCRPNEAKEYMKRVLELYKDIYNQSLQDPESVEKPTYDFRVGTAKILMELNEFEKAEEILDHLAQEFEKVVDLWYLLGVCCQHQKDYKTAIENYQKAVELGQKLKEDPKFLKEIREELITCEKLYSESVKNGNTQDDDNDEEWEDVDSASDDDDELIVVDHIESNKGRKADYFDDV